MIWPLLIWKFPLGVPPPPNGLVVVPPDGDQAVVVLDLPYQRPAESSRHMVTPTYASSVVPDAVVSSTPLTVTKPLWIPHPLPAESVSTLAVGAVIVDRLAEGALPV